MERKSLIIIIIFLLLGVVVLSSKAYAQIDPRTADFASREVDRSFVGEVEDKLTAPPKKAPPIREARPAKPYEKKEPYFYVERVVLTGNKSVPYKKFEMLLDDYSIRMLTMSELRQLARRVEQIYVNEGIVAACIIPPQDTRGGVIELRVVEAELGKVEIKEGSYYEPDQVNEYWGRNGGYFKKKKTLGYWSIKPGQPIRYEKMMKSLQLMNKNPDRLVGATLHAGEEPGTTDVLLDVRSRFPIHPIFTFDKEGTVQTGRNRYGFGGRHNNFLGFDDTLIGGYTFGEDFSGFYLYHSVPVTYAGTSVMYGYSYSKSCPKKQYESFGIKAESENYSLYLRQDLYRKGDYFGELAVGFDANDKTVRDYDGTITRNRYRILRFENTLLYRNSIILAYLKTQYSQGLNFLGARRRNPPISQYTNTFSKITAETNSTLVLPFRFQVHSRFKGQLAFDKLASQEQLSLGGIDSVRGYPASDFLADTGFHSNQELRIPVFFLPESVRIPFTDKPLKELVTGVFFYDHGYGEVRGQTGDLTKNVHYASIGGGVRISLFRQTTLRMEWGVPLADEPLTEHADSHFHIAVNVEV